MPIPERQSWAMIAVNWRALVSRLRLHKQSKMFDAAYALAQNVSPHVDYNSLETPARDKMAAERSLDHLVGPA
jgi:hypothetical protein